MLERRARTTTATTPSMRHHRRRCSMRTVLLGALALLLFAGTVASAAAPATGGGLVVVASTDDESASANPPAESATTSSGAGDAPQKRIPEFVATDEWKEILPGQGIPRGLHVRMNLETGKREAKLMDPTDTHVDESLRSVVVDPDATVTVATDVGGAVDTVVTKKTAHDASEPRASADDDEAPPVHEPAWNHEKMYEVLQALPEPPTLDDGMDLYDAHAKLSTPEFRRQIIKLWKKRQEDLKEALASMQDDSKHLSTLLEQLQDAERAGNTDDMVQALEVLEWEVQDLDKTHVFNFIGGFDVLTAYLNATDLAVRAHASWVVGSAAKNYRDGQTWAIDAGALPKLIDALALDAPATANTANATDIQRAVFEVKKKALYAISSLVLFSERGQRLFLLHGGPELLARVFDDKTHPTSVQLKAALLVHDLLLETDAASDTESSLQQLQRSFRSTEWCERLATFFLEHTSSLRQRQALEILGAMRNQLPACRATFESLGVKSAVETVAAAFAADSNGDDDDEQRDILAFMTDLVRLL